ncbi:murein L,D-transpeptidase catalytic domain family protein [Flavitalea flava]
MKDLKGKGGKYGHLFILLFIVVITWSFITPSLNFKAVAGKGCKQDTVTAPAENIASGLSTPHRSLAYDPLGFGVGPVVFTFSDSIRFNFLYDSLNLDSLDLSREAYQKAIQGFLNLESSGEIRNAGVLSIIDFSLPSSKKRLFILDMFNGRLLFNSLVSHGRNSGTVMATRFSNRCNSFMTSLGFYLTGDAFRGKHGYSLRLEGIERGWNDNVSRRAIILHPAGYVSEEHIRQSGFLGRSEGCPAIPKSLNKAIINTIRGGSCLFLYGADDNYIRQSKILS